MTMQVPVLLALLATALVAIAIFAPHGDRAPVAVSYAPPLAEPAIERWTPAVRSPAAAAAVTWPALVDARARGCDVIARIALVEALTVVRGPWAAAILARADAEEHDDAVRAALARALAAPPPVPADV